MGSYYRDRPKRELADPLTIAFELFCWEVKSISKALRYEFQGRAYGAGRRAIRNAFWTACKHNGYKPVEINARLGGAARKVHWIYKYDSWREVENDDLLARLFIASIRYAYYERIRVQSDMAFGVLMYHYFYALALPYIQRTNYLPSISSLFPTDLNKETFRIYQLNTSLFPNGFWRYMDDNRAGTQKKKWSEKWIRLNPERWRQLCIE